MGGSIRRRGEESFEVSIDLGRDSDGRRIRKYFTVKGTKEKAKERLNEVVEAYDNAEWEAKLQAIRQESQEQSAKAKYISNGGPGFYRSLPPDQKLQYHGRGCVYCAPRQHRDGNKVHAGGLKKTRHGPNSYRMEGSSGERSPRNGKIKYRSLTVWGTYDQARSLLDLIVAVPYRSIEEAEEVIKPYYIWEGSGINKSQNRKRCVRGLIPTVEYMTPPQIKRERVQLEYWRMRLLDTIEAYRRFDDD